VKQPKDKRRGEAAVNVIVVGGGKVGFYLIRTLLEHKHKVSVIEKDPQRCEVLAGAYPVLVINGDGTNPGDLADAGADYCDVLAAVTGKDEENLLVCQIAKRKFDVKRCIARVNNPKNQDVFRELGINTAVSSTAIIAGLIEREMALGHMRTLLTFHHGDLSILELDLLPTSPAAGRTVVELAPSLPPESILVAVMRRNRVIFPRGNTVLEAGDTVMALVHSEAVATVSKTLVGEG
jgi:trk system potassium uptake protein